MESNNTPPILPPHELTDELIFKWEYLETLGQEPQSGDQETQQYLAYKNLKSRYIFEVTNWFQQPIANNGQESRPDTSIRQIEDYVNGKLPIQMVPQFPGMPQQNQTLKWISVKWASQKAFARFFCENNNMEWDHEKFLIVKRIKKGFFEFWCNKCDHSWSTHYGTFKFYIAFKKDKNGILLEDEVFVRVIAYKLDCKNCTFFAEAGQYQFKGAKLGPEHIGRKYIDHASYSVGNTILKIFGYLPPDDRHKGKFMRPREMQEQHQFQLCGACKFGDCVWVKESKRINKHNQ